MKNLFYSLIALLTLSLCIACGDDKKDKKDKDQVPTTSGMISEAVATAFHEKYPNEKSPDWEIDDQGNFEAKFKKKGEKYRADFSESGKWIETENSIKADNLPKPIKAILKAQYDDHKIVEVERVQHHSKGLFYDVELKKDGKKMDVEFKADGTIIGTE